MPHKSPAEKREYMRPYYRKNKEARKLNKKASARRKFERDPEAVRAKWRAEKKLARIRAIMRELVEIKANRPAPAPLGYTGQLRPNGF